MGLVRPSNLLWQGLRTEGGLEIRSEQSYISFQGIRKECRHRQGKRKAHPECLRWYNELAGHQVRLSMELAGKTIRHHTVTPTWTMQDRSKLGIE